MNAEDDDMTISIPSGNYSVPFRWLNGMPTMKAVFVRPDNLFADGDCEDGDDVEAMIGIDTGTQYNVMSYDLMCTLFDAGALDDDHIVVHSDKELIVLVERIELHGMVIDNIQFRVFNIMESWIGWSFLNALKTYSIDYKNLKMVFSCRKT